MLKHELLAAQDGHKRGRLSLGTEEREMYRLYALVFGRRVCDCPAMHSIIPLRCDDARPLQALQA